VHNADNGEEGAYALMKGVRPHYNDSMTIVSAKALIKDYDSFRAVNGIDFEIFQGECFGFLGPNGAGKTTVMRVIYCFIPPTSGEVKVFGMNVFESPSKIKARIGVMPQEDNLDPDLNVFENLIVYARYFDIPEKVSSSRAWELLEFVEMKDRAKVKIDNLSGVAENIKCPIAVVVKIDQPEAARLFRFLNGIIDLEALHLRAKQIVVVASDPANKRRLHTQFG